MELETNMPGSSAFMRSSQNLKKAIQRERSKKKGYPQKAKTYQDLSKIPDHLTITADGKPFLILNEPVNREDTSSDGKKILVFMSKTGKEILAGCSSWYVDGTFKPATETLFSQIVFVVGLTGMGKAIPCVFALLPNKEKSTYLRLAEFIREEMTDMGDLPVSNIMMDYEKGLNVAFNITFESCAIVGCDFHWKKCLLKRLSDDGLLELYNTDADFHLLTRYVWALSYVPQDQVIHFWETYIANRVRAGSNGWKNLEAEVAKFLTYVDNNWIGKLDRKTSQRKKSVFPYSMWNKFEVCAIPQHYFFPTIVMLSQVMRTCLSLELFVNRNKNS
jgi:hypothetical protein